MKTRNTTITRYGQMRLDYLKGFKRSLFAELTMNGKLEEHILNIQDQAKERALDLEDSLRAATPAPDSQDTLKMIQYQNQIQQRAEELMLNEIIYR